VIDRRKAHERQVSDDLTPDKDAVVIGIDGKRRPLQQKPRLSNQSPCGWVPRWRLTPARPQGHREVRQHNV
jgi:hypothetical protein